MNRVKISAAIPMYSSGNILYDTYKNVERELSRCATKDRTFNKGLFTSMFIGFEILTVL